MPTLSQVNSMVILIMMNSRSFTTTRTTLQILPMSHHQWHPIMASILRSEFTQYQYPVKWSTMKPTTQTLLRPISTQIKTLHTTSFTLQGHLIIFLICLLWHGTTLSFGFSLIKAFSRNFTTISTLEPRVIHVTLCAGSAKYSY